jgi:hypothetical protein
MDGPAVISPFLNDQRAWRNLQRVWAGTARTGGHAAPGGAWQSLNGTLDAPKGSDDFRRS